MVGEICVGYYRLVIFREDRERSLKSSRSDLSRYNRNVTFETYYIVSNRAPSCALLLLPRLQWLSHLVPKAPSKYLSQLRAASLLAPRPQTFPIATKELPRLRQDLTARNPKLTAITGQACFKELVECVNDGESQSARHSRLLSAQSRLMQM